MQTPALCDPVQGEYGHVDTYDRNEEEQNAVFAVNVD